MNTIVERAIEITRQQREAKARERHAASGRSKRITPTRERIALIIARLNEKEADVIKAAYYRYHKLMNLTVDNSREIVTRPAPRVGSKMAGFR